MSKTACCAYGTVAHQTVDVISGSNHSNVLLLSTSLSIRSSSSLITTTATQLKGRSEVADFAFGSRPHLICRVAIENSYITISLTGMTVDQINMLSPSKGCKSNLCF